MVPVLQERPRNVAVYQSAIGAGYSQLQARVLAARLEDPSHIGDWVSPSIKLLDPPDRLPDIGMAAEAIADAVMDERVTIIGMCDHDCDGSDAMAVLRTAMVDYFGVAAGRFMPIVSHRLREGYGVSESVVDRTLLAVKLPALVITADQGSADELRIAKLAAAGVPTVVTDHHGVEGAGPPSALACVNPARKDSAFGDPYIAGVHVAFLVMCAVRTELIKRGHVAATAPSLSALLDFSALGTAADAVSMAKSRNNRAIVRYGLHLMNTKPRPAWEAMRAVMKKEGPFTSKDLAFGFAPRVNSRGRMGDAMASADFLTATDPSQAIYLAELLNVENESRKLVERRMRVDAADVAQAQADAGMACLVIHLVNGHPGVHGILASRLVEAHGRPVCCLSPKQGVEGVVTGSLRTIPGVHIRDALIAVDTAHPGLLLSHGGHAGAGGVALTVGRIEEFHGAFADAVTSQADPSTFRPVVWTDGSLMRSPSMAIVDELQSLEPYGREFDTPTFTDVFQVRAIKPVGDGSHLKVELKCERGDRHKGIWFSAVAPGAAVPIADGDWIQATYQVTRNTFRGNSSVDLQISAATVFHPDEGQVP